jgi:hypothetical protein
VAAISHPSTLSSAFSFTPGSLPFVNSTPGVPRLTPLLPASPTALNAVPDQDFEDARGAQPIAGR